MHISHPQKQMPTANVQKPTGNINNLQHAQSSEVKDVHKQPVNISQSDQASVHQKPSSNHSPAETAFPDKPIKNIQPGTEAVMSTEAQNIDDLKQKIQSQMNEIKQGLKNGTLKKEIPNNVTGQLKGGQGLIFESLEKLKNQNQVNNMMGSTQDAQLEKDLKAMAQLYDCHCCDKTKAKLDELMNSLQQIK